MNILAFKTRVLAISALVDGNSIRGASRICGIHRDTTMRLNIEVGQGCKRLHDNLVRDVHASAIEMDEIWAYVGCKEGHRDESQPEEYGDQYTWVAMCATTRLVIAYRTDRRDGVAAKHFAHDVRARVLGRPQITTDGHKPYLDAIEEAFGVEVDYAQILKTYRADEAGGASRDDVRYSRGRVTRSVKRPVTGTPDPDKISTSYIERQNLTVRMNQRRLTRLTNAFSKKLPNLQAAIALHYMHYNFCRVHETLRVTPAMQAGLTDHVWSIEELINAAEDAPEPPPAASVAPPTPPPSGGTFRRIPTGATVLPGQLTLPGMM